MDDYEITSPPVVLNYGNAKPLGYKATQKLTRFFPISSLPNTDIIRFIINSNGYWDPYSSYLRFNVRVKKTGNPMGNAANNAGNACQLDNSAASLIQTMSFIQNGVEIERIDRYEVLASMLNDMFFSKEQRAQRAHQGFGPGLPETLKAVVNGGVVDAATEATDTSIATNGEITVSTTAATVTTNVQSYNAVYQGHINVLGGSMPIMDSGSKTLPVTVTGGNYVAVVAPSVPCPSPYFDGAGEPILQGDSSNDKYQISFCIPIISGLFGVLMPADEIKYIPMQFFQNLEMNFRINPYAFHNLNPASTDPRNFEITACELFVNIIHFAPEISSSIAKIVKERGMHIHTCSYYQGPSHMVAAGGSLETYPINMSFKSLRSLIWCFLPADYRSKPYVRELRRKALAVISAQARIGGDLYPTFPIGNLSSGHSGLPRANSDFLVNTYKAFGRLHDTVNDSLVNSYTFCAGNLLSTADYSLGQTARPYFNWNTKTRGYQQSAPSYGYPEYDGSKAGAGVVSCPFTNCNWLVNQIVPRAVYGIDLDTITSDDSVISGVNTLLNKPFELLLEGTNPTDVACELVMFMYYDMVVMIDTDYTVKYLGRGG